MSYGDPHIGMHVPVPNLKGPGQRNMYYIHHPQFHTRIVINYMMVYRAGSYSDNYTLYHACIYLFLVDYILCFPTVASYGLRRKIYVVMCRPCLACTSMYSYVCRVWKELLFIYSSVVFIVEFSHSACNKAIPFSVSITTTV